MEIYLNYKLYGGNLKKLIISCFILQDYKGINFIDVLRLKNMND